MTSRIFLADTVVVVGKIGSGKSTVVRSISEEFRMKIVSFGALMRARAFELGLETTRGTLQDIGQEMFAEQGPDGILRDAMAHSKVETGESIVFDGVRHKAMLEEIKNISRTSITIFLRLNDRKRYRRNLLKNALDSSMSFQEFLTISNHPVEEGIEPIAAVSDVLIDSTPPAEDVWERVHDALARLS